MRDIIFRGKRIDNGEWLYGSFCPDLLEVFCGDDYLDGYIKPYEREKEKRYQQAVERETVGQYIGLKDKRGKKIFEGDVISGYFDGEKITGTIVYGSNAQYYIERGGLLGIYLDNAQDWVEVIGNIYDNPELLKEEA